MDTPYRADLLARLTQARPVSLLSVGAHERAFYAEYLDGAACEFHCLPLAGAVAELAALGRFQIAVVAPGRELISKTDAAMLIARLRDLHADRVVVALDESATVSAWDERELRALGLIHLATDTSYALYEYDLAHYKQTPDWLNSQFWAHPELYDKFRW